MGRFFDVNNSVWSFIGKIFDAFVLHLLWVVCCLPVITAGAATAALYYALIKDIRDEEGHYVRAFFKSFRTNMKQGIIIGVPDLLLGVLLLLAVRFYLLFPGEAAGNASVNYMIILPALPYIFFNRYIFAYLGIFSDSIRNLLKGAFIMMAGHLGRTFLMSLIFCGFYFLVVYFELWPLLIFGYGLVAYLNSWILNGIFSPYIDRILRREEENREGAEI